MTVAAMKNEIGGWENLPGARTRHFKTAVVKHEEVVGLGVQNTDDCDGQS